ncbi:hypothetical protein [Mucilaginibacter sp.]|uniref:hypothetical protein n=1 Tax=Mucilaginibacter sp. TaxID=1882438 RepID=UPI003D09CF3F
MENEKKTSWRRHDYRFKSLFMIIDGLSKSISELEKNVADIHWYDGDWLMEETETIYGLAFIAMQNYINGSISDIDGTTKNKNIFYKKDNPIEDYTGTTIELITALANYTKHKDEGVPHSGTLSILESFNLRYDVIYLDEAAVFQGLTILNKDYDLFKIMDYVVKWRESLWLAIE